MSHDLSAETTLRAKVWITLGALAVFVFVGLLFYSTLGSSPSTGEQHTEARAEENDLEKARQLLSRNTGPEACRTAILHVRSYLSDPAATEQVPALGSEERAQLTSQLALAADEEEEIRGTAYTLLDAAHLARCLMLDDAARTLASKEGQAAPAGLDQARTAFAWVMRQVRLQESREEPVPPHLVLERGWGTPLERALVFLALLEQIGSSSKEGPDLLGCLLVRTAEDGKQQLWACGVLPHGSRHVYLFDPRLGIPIPGPQGKGVATLEQASSQDEVLGQLSQGGKLRYEPSRKEARAAQVLLVCPLSAVSARMRYLQDTLLAPAIKARLAAAPLSEQKAFKEATGREVSFWRPGTSLLRHFLPPEEGGVDQPKPVPMARLGGYTSAKDPNGFSLSRRQLFQLSLVPWTKMPAQLRDPLRFPVNVGLGQRVRSYFAGPFLRSAQEYNGSRHLLLRGRYDQAVQVMMQEKSQWQQLRKQHASNPNAARQADVWVEDAIDAYAHFERVKDGPQRAEAEQKIEGLWAEAEALFVVLGAALAEARQGDVVYQLALCKQEQAEQMQTRLEGAAGKPSDQQKELVQQVRQDALAWWTTFLENNNGHPAAAAARRLRAEVHLRLGDNKAALADLNELAASAPSEMEKIAARYQAEQLRRQQK